MSTSELGRPFIKIYMSLSALVLALLGSINLFSKEEVKVDNLNKTQNSIALTKVIKKDTIETYNDSIPTGTTITKQEGQDGLSYVNEKGETIEVISEPINQKVEIGTGKRADYVGKITGYGADCAGCSPTGTMSCKTKNGGYHSLRYDGKTYNDSDYGEIRIVAAALSEFPCGTVMDIIHPTLGTFKAIVLDTGGAMIKDWANGVVHMDLAFATENDPEIHNVTNSNVKYIVQRWGW